jgi:hypothetical protein
MQHQNPAVMTPDEIIQEIGSLERELSVRVTRMHRLAQGLYHQVRRAPSDDNTAVYITYANAWMRFAGIANQGAMRTVLASKVLRKLTPLKTQEDTKKSLPAKLKPVVPTSPVEDLITLYGKDAFVEVSEPAGMSEDVTNV